MLLSVVNYWVKYWPRILVTLLPVVFALLHAGGFLKLGVLDRLDHIIYDARMRVLMPNTLDERVVIVDIDEKSLAELGRWPWSRNVMADLVNRLFDEQQVAVLGMDVVFAEPDQSSGLDRLKRLAEGDLRGAPGFAERLSELEKSLDYDGLLAEAMRDRPVVLGYYMTSDRQGRKSGVLPAPVMDKSDLKGRPVQISVWDGYGSNLPVLAEAAPMAGFFNPVVDADGVVRSIPLLVEHEAQYYESLSLAMFRVLTGLPRVSPGLANDSEWVRRNYQNLQSVVLTLDDQQREIPVADQVHLLIPFRGRGGVDGGSFRYVSAADVLNGTLKPGELKDKIIIFGATAPGLLDLRVTPVGEIYPGVETHANIIAGLLDDNLLVQPDYAPGYDLLMTTLSGLFLAMALPAFSALAAVLVSVAVALLLLALNTVLYVNAGLVLPLASSLLMVTAAFALNMSYGYFIESRSKRELANLFGTYVPPELVDEMVKNPESYSMAAQEKELTVMFSDMRGFTHMSETMEPQQLQALLNGVFSRLTSLIRGKLGTIDKYMGDCVMAFWGAPVTSPTHAQMAVAAALQMRQAIIDINTEHRNQGLPEIGMGVGLNTGTMCVGDMGSNIRRSYTVIGDAVNLGSRLEGLSKQYGVDIVVSESTQAQAPGFVWQELDLVKVKGKDEAVTIFSPLGDEDLLNDVIGNVLREELKLWSQCLKAYRAQDWDRADLILVNLTRINPNSKLYRLYQERVSAMRLLPFDPGWDGSTAFDTK